jgi:hypothetical protein
MGKLLQKHLMEYQEGDERVILRWIIGKYVVRMGDGWNWIRTMSSGGVWY